MNAKRILLPALLCAAMASCTVKEDRGPCPCVLDIWFEDDWAANEKVAVSGWDSRSGRLFLDRIVPGQYDGSYSRKVEKGMMHVCAYTGIDAMTLKGDRLVIPEGKQCDPVWAFCGSGIDASGETAEEHITMHKQHAVVHIKADLPSNMDGDIVLRAKGNVNGFDIDTMSPVRGDFSCLATLGEDHGFIVIVPRQLDNSLELEVFLDGVLSRTVKAGELIANAGYSWDKEDLDDIYLSLSLFKPGQAMTSVNEWDIQTHILTY